MTLAVDMQTRCTLVQCRTPREVRYLSSKANSFPRSIVFPGAIAFSTHAKPPTVVPCQRTITVCTCSRPPGNPKAYHSPTQHCPLSREGRVGKTKSCGAQELCVRTERSHSPGIFRNLFLLPGLRGVLLDPIRIGLLLFWICLWVCVIHL